MLAALVLSQLLTPVARVTLKPLDEMSGLAPARRRGVYWTHNDSGDSARIFAVDLKGNAIVPTGASAESFEGWSVEGAKNHDWEEICTDGKSLFISDMGNNGNARRDMGIYVLPEPNLDAPGPLKRGRFLSIRYADQTEFPAQNYRFDCEAIFVRKGLIYLLTKHRKNQGPVPDDATNLYRFDPRKKNSMAQRIAGKEKLGGWVTGCSVSPSGKTLAVLTNAPVASVWLFDLSRPEKSWLQGGRQIQTSGVRQAEAVAWVDESELVISNEQRDLFRLLVN